MNAMFVSLYVHIQKLINREEGQDLVEYSLVVALIALGSTAAVGNVGTAIGTAFSTISSTLVSAL